MVFKSICRSRNKKKTPPKLGPQKSSPKKNHLKEQNWLEFIEKVKITVYFLQELFL